MKRAASVVLLALAATVAARADDAKTPLADSRKQLQQLQKDTAAAQAGPADASLKGAVPSLQATLPAGSAPPAPVLDPNQDPQGKRRNQKDANARNWLVDGYNQLDPKAAREKKDDRMPADAPQADDAGKGTANGQPDTLIKVYETQVKSTESRYARDEKPASPAAPDPLAPFLQGWLANSPVRDAALASLAKGDNPGLPANGPAPVSVAPGDGPAASPMAIPLSDHGPGSAPDNPYLLNVTLPVLNDSTPSALLPTPAGAVNSLANGPTAGPSMNGPAGTPVPPVRLEPLKPPPTPADEDKKYFPQLKRF